MASLCVGYLSFPGFYDMLDDESVNELLHNGYYAFLDYAACYWAYHLKSGLELGINEISSQELINFLRMFMDTHRRSPAKHVEIRGDTRQVFNGLQLQSTWHDFETFLGAFQATETQVQTFEDSTLLNEVLDLPDVIKRIRKILEESQNNLNVYSTDNISAFYGNELYKCPRMSCDFFYVGFSTGKQRDDHLMKHSRPFGCSFPGCLRSALAFSSQKELERHTLHAHRPTPGESGYASKRKKLSLKCKTCKNGFSNPQNLLSHKCEIGENNQKIKSSHSIKDGEDTHLENLQQESLESPMPLLDELSRCERKLPVQLSTEQIETIHRTAISPYLRPDLPSSENIKTWGQFKGWLASTSQSQFKLDMSKTLKVCKEYDYALSLATLPQPRKWSQAQRAETPPLQRYSQRQGSQESNSQNLPPEPRPNIPGLRPITSSDVAMARQRLGPQADKLTYQQIVSILSKRQQQVLEQAAATRARNETNTAPNTLSRPPPSMIPDLNPEYDIKMSQGFPVAPGERPDTNEQNMPPTMANTITSGIPLPSAKERAFNKIFHDYGPSATQTVTQLQQPKEQTYQPQLYLDMRHNVDGQMPHSQYQSQDEDHIDYRTLPPPPQYIHPGEDQYASSNWNSGIDIMPPHSDFNDIVVSRGDSPLHREPSGLLRPATPEAMPVSRPLEKFSKGEIPGNPKQGIYGPRPKFSPDIGQTTWISPPSINVEFAPPQRNFVDLDSLTPPATRKFQSI